MKLLRNSSIVPSLFLANVQSLRPKYEELCLTASCLAPHLLVLCESWLSGSVSNEEVLIPQYSVIRCDRKGGRKGGGVCVYVRNAIRYQNIMSSRQIPNCIEAVWLQITESNIILLAIYIPPGLTSENHKNISDYIVDTYDEIADSNSEEFLIIAGDLNQYPTDTVEAQLNLVQIVDSPTRGCAILDKILLDSRLLRHLSNTALTSNSSNRDPLVTICSSVGSSDHLSVLMRSGAFSNELQQVRKVYDFRESYIHKFKAKLSEFPWTSFYNSDLSVEEKCDILHAAIDHALTMLPFTYVTMTDRDKPWMTPTLKSLINRRYEAFRCKNFPLYLHYKKKVKEEISHAKAKWVNSKIENAAGLWSIVRSTANKSKDQTLSGLLQNFPSIHEAVEQISQKLTLAFSPSPNWNDILLHLPPDDQNWTPHCDPDIICNSLQHLNIRKAAGSDDLSPRLLRDAAHELASPLTHVICLSLDTCIVPSRWKTAKVTPIPKKANPSIDDLRPLSMLPIFSKILEKIVLRSIKDSLIAMYGPNQFGFRPQYSTIHAHLSLHDFVTRILDSPAYKVAVVISFDIKKAFDSLHHAHLMESLKNGNVPSKALRWIASFLQNRYQSVCVKGVHSSLTPVSSGVPQGSVLAPFLFAAHMGSLMPHDSNTLMIKYADDVVTVTPVANPSEVESVVKSEIFCVRSWCQSHGLQLNTQKTKVMIPAKASACIPPIPCIELSSYIKILGLIFTNDLKWDAQIDSVCRKASQRIFILKRLKTLLTKEDQIRVYNALILSVLEYNSAVMVGMSKKNLSSLEKVRKRCHRLICGADCRCGDFACVRDRIYQQALKLFTTITSDTNNLLHSIVPKRLPRSQKFAVEFCGTSKRQRSFSPYCALMLNGFGL